MKIELNRDQIKYIAVFTMLLNHVANIFLQPGTFACEALKDIGYFTAPVMCWFLVEGYRYTRSVKKYAGRLLIFAVISQLPYYLAFARNHLAPVVYFKYDIYTFSVSVSDDRRGKNIRSGKEKSGCTGNYSSKQYL